MGIFLTRHPKFFTVRLMQSALHFSHWQCMVMSKIIQNTTDFAMLILESESTWNSNMETCIVSIITVTQFFDRYGSEMYVGPQTLS